MQGKFRYLNVGLGVILAFVGVKMLQIGEPFEVHLPTAVSLGVVAAVITIAVVASVRADARDRRLACRPMRSAGSAGSTQTTSAGVEPAQDPARQGDGRTADP